jgi:hypothetical protein
MTIAALCWRGGDRLTLTADVWVMIARRDPGSMVTVPTRPYIVIPATLAARCGPMITCFWPPCLARTCWPPTHSRWSPRRLARMSSFPRDEGGWS